MSRRPRVVVLAGPNGAGKSTLAPALLRDRVRIECFLNADVIASGLSAFAPAREALRAGRIMLRALREKAAAKEDVAFESTLASRTFAPLLRRMTRDGYRVELVYLALASPKQA